MANLFPIIFCPNNPAGLLGQKIIDYRQHCGAGRRRDLLMHWLVLLSGAATVHKLAIRMYCINYLVLIRCSNMRHFMRPLFSQPFSKCKIFCTYLLTYCESAILHSIMLYCTSTKASHQSSVMLCSCTSQQTLSMIIFLKLNSDA